LAEIGADEYIDDDVEEYFHAEAFAGVVRPEDWPTLSSRVVDATERVLDILDYADVRATFFVLGWVAERQPDLVQEIHARGHELACHGYSHQMISRQTPQEFADDEAGEEGDRGISGTW
jgi:peptidoglycan/xylan/chitin deacetylase (PgdA/CDA1 family)